MAVIYTTSTTGAWTCDNNGATATSTGPGNSVPLPDGWAHIQVNPPNGGTMVTVDLCPTCYAAYQAFVANFLATHPTGE